MAPRPQRRAAGRAGRPPRGADRGAPGRWATLETYTVQHAAGSAVVIGRLDDGRRFLASTKDEETLGRLLDGEPIGSKIHVRSFGFGNRVTMTAERMDELFPPRAPGFRDDYEHILVRRDGHLLEVTINRPDSRNSLHPPANAELDEVFDAYFADPELWVAIITGAGDKAFSAGNDLVYSASGKPMWVPRNGLAGLTSRESLPKPVIAAVNGFALGGGCEIALACHLVVADETAQFGLPEVRAGLVAAAGGLVRLPRAIPPKVARDVILTGRRLSAAEAESYGLISRVAPAGQAPAVARELAAAILEGSPTSVRASLRIMAEADGFADTVEAVRHPSPALDELLVSQDAFEGPAAFAQKRKPVWRNR
ncbi:enoyl-CoA hydratase-related protein [Amycolatopsis methanolica]|uniref:enoyl-CoA hydratase-related protein n=1 Tax=Amycolatopsis methanolica TaxID=1814 RepID=UPI00344627CB